MDFVFGGCMYKQVTKEMKVDTGSFTLDEIVHKGLFPSVDAHTLATSCTYESKGRHLCL